MPKRENTHLVNGIAPANDVVVIWAIEWQISSYFLDS